MRHFTKGHRILVAVTLTLTLIGSACGDSDDSDASAATIASEPEGAAELHSSSDVEESDDTYYAVDPEGGDGEARPVAESPRSEEMPPETTTTAASFDETTSSVDEVERQQLPSLTAGWVDDNEMWNEYLQYREWFGSTGVAAREVYVEGRHIVQVTTAAGTPVLGATVELWAAQDLAASSMTHSSGRALLFPAPLPAADQQQVEPAYTLRVAKNGAEQMVAVAAGTREHTVVLDTPASRTPVALDVHFLIDATGSMEDEIDRLKANMISVAENIAALPAEPDVRFGMTTYRDRGDIYVTRSTDFTGDVQTFTEALGRVSAGGGGDYPESLNQGLHDAIHESSWRVNDAVSVMILLADAPPHLDYESDVSYDVEAFQAAVRGITIMPIASSGLDVQGEYILRQLAQITDGSFVFLTYGADGGPGGSTTHHVDDYSVLPLDELVVQLVADELAPLTGANAQQ